MWCKLLKTMFSKACEYGIKAAIFIATKSQNNQRVGLKLIAKEIDSPEAFTAKILQKLSKEEIVSSIKGPHGGFEINKARAKEVKLRDIVFAIDGNGIYQSCALGFSSCSDSKPCAMHNKFAAIRNDLKEMLENTSLLDLSDEVNKGASLLKL